jgi:hypothetical protein
MARSSKADKEHKFYDSMAKAGFSYNKERSAYYLDVNANEMYTVFTKFPGEDHYSEEIDVLVGGLGPGASGEAMEIARMVIKWGFDPKLYPAEVVHRPKGIVFF